MTASDTVERHGMTIDWDVKLEMDDGTILRADVFRPTDDDEYPVIMTYGPYGKWLHFEDGFERAWNSLVENHPEVLANSSNMYLNWETVDPEKWVPDGYAVVRVDSRGAGRSEGHI
ncbi:MAG: CocE/NonD family hydrolase, partial [Halobacteriaceae archaeon]